jgi:hypothetical protein
VARITVEVGSGAARYKIAVQAGSVQRVLEIAKGLSPDCDLEVTFPVDLETSSVEDLTLTVGPVEREKSAA